MNYLHSYHLTIPFEIKSLQEDPADALEDGLGKWKAIQKLKDYVEELEKGLELSYKADCQDSVELNHIPYIPPKNF